MVQSRKSPASKQKGLQLKLLTGAKSHCVSLKDDNPGGAFESEWPFVTCLAVDPLTMLPAETTPLSSSQDRI